MSRWRLSDQKPESTFTRRLRNGLAAVLLIVGISSLFFSPMAWPFLLVYTCLGLVAGLLMSLGDLAGLVGLVILFGAAGAATFLNGVEPEWHQAWWQPGIIALMGLAIEHLTPQLIRRLR